MIEVVDTVLVHAPAESVAQWLRDMPKHYLSWHPQDHVAFRVIEGPTPLARGSVAYARERIGRFTLGFRFRITEDAARSVVRWQALFPFTLINLCGSLEAVDAGDGDSRLVAITSFGWRTPAAGRMFDWAAARCGIRDALRKHMHEEGLYLKAEVTATCLGQRGHQPGARGD